MLLLAILSVFALITAQGSSGFTRKTGQEAADELKKLSPEQRMALRAQETLALKKAPLDREAIFRLALLAELDGDMALRDKLITEGARRSRRDPKLQISAFQLALRDKHYADAVSIADGMMRSRPELNATTFDLVKSLIASDEGLLAFTASMKGTPPWRLPLLEHLLKNDPEARTAYRLIAGARKAGVEVSDLEVGQVIQKLIVGKRHESAYFIWLDFLSKEALTKVGPIFDGGFSLPSRTQYFDWTILNAPNVRTELRLRSGNGVDRILSVHFTDFSEQYFHVGQYLQLQPGSYRVSGESEANAFKTSGGLVWRVSCVETQSLAGQSRPFKEDGPWDNFDFAVNIPETGCATQLLRLVSAGTTPLDLKISGLIAFDNFKIAPQ
jgi:hypothetical protein